MDDEFFDQLYENDLQGDPNYYQEVAQNYVPEFNAWMGKAQRCKNDLKTEAVKLKALEKVDKQNVREIETLREMILHRDQQIKKLGDMIRAEKDKLENQRTSNKLHLPSTHVVDPREIIEKAMQVLEKVKADNKKFLCSGQHTGVNETISEIRDIFNLMVNQLNQLNIKNHFVSRTLDSLQQLDAAEDTLRAMKAPKKDLQALFLR